MMTLLFLTESLPTFFFSVYIIKNVAERYKEEYMNKYCEQVAKKLKEISILYDGKNESGIVEEIRALQELPLPEEGFLYDKNN